MNTQRLLEMADWLEKGAPHEHVIFNMNTLMNLHLKESSRGMIKENICCTSCCIAGCALQFYAPEIFNDPTTFAATMDNLGFMVRIATDVLGLDDEQAEELFYPSDDTMFSCYADIPPEWAGKVIRHLVKTGKVEWMKFSPKDWREA